MILPMEILLYFKVKRLNVPGPEPVRVPFNSYLQIRLDYRPQKAHTHTPAGVNETWLLLLMNLLKLLTVP